MPLVHLNVPTLRRLFAYMRAREMQSPESRERVTDRERWQVCAAMHMLRVYTRFEHYLLQSMSDNYTQSYAPVLQNLSRI
jgi:hypothetical protein